MLRNFIFIILLSSSHYIFSQNKHFTKEDLELNSKTILEEKFIVKYVNKYSESMNNSIFLENGYASYTLKNPQEYLDIKKINVNILSVTLIYTNYPANKDLWRTNYRYLITSRLKELFKLDSNLNSNTIKWGIQLQTDCNSESQAQLLPHGIEIEYVFLTKDSIDTINIIEKKREGIQEADTSSKNNSDEKQIRDFIKRINSQTDSTIERVFNRHNEWKNSLVVMDWTGSMQKFGAQVILWHTLNLKRSGIKHLAIFNDVHNEVNGKIGDGVYCTELTDIKKVIKLMKKAKNEMVKNEEIEENNIEAILKGMEKFSEFSEVIMIADNRSCMKDYYMIDKIKVPVKIILCGTSGGINPQ